MVKAGDIGKASKDYLKKDFFSSNEVKVTQGKNTTTFKLGDAVKAEHKIELGSCPLTKLPAKITLGSSTDADCEWTVKSGASTVKVTAATNLASALDINNLKLKKTFDIEKDVSGILTTLNLDTSTKGTSFIQPVNFGLGFQKAAYQFGVTGTVENITAPALSKTQFHLGFSPCPSGGMSVSAVTTTGSDWVINALAKKDGRTYAVDLNTTNWAANIATNLPNGKMKVSSGGVLTSYQKFPVSESVSARFGGVLDLKSGQISGMGIGVDFSL